MNLPRPVIPSVECSVRSVAHELELVGWSCKVHAVARSGRTVYLTIANSQVSYRLRISDHTSRAYRVTHKAKQVLVNRQGNLRAVVEWIRSRRVAACNAVASGPQS